MSRCAFVPSAAAAAATVLLWASNAHATPLKDIPGLTGITFWEITYSTLPNSFAPDSAALQRIAGSLGPVGQSMGGYDFSYYPGEYYDVFYSNADGTANPNGGYLTIDGVWRAGGLTIYGGMNINEVTLDFGGTHVNADVVTHKVYGSTCLPGYGVNCDFNSHLLAVDGNLNTFPRFGQTSDNDLADRFSLTVGFSGYSAVSAVPEPATMAMLLGGLGLMGAVSRINRQAVHPRRRPYTRTKSSVTLTGQ